MWRDLPQSARHGDSVGSTLRRRLAQVFVFVGVPVLLGAAIAVGALLSTISQTDDLVDRYNPARVQSGELEVAYLNQETAVRGYVLTGSTDFLDPYQQGRETERRNVNSLRTSLAQEPALVHGINTVEAAAMRWRMQFAEPTIAAVRAGKQVPTQNLQTGKGLFDDLRNSLNRFQANLTAVRQEARADLARTTRLLNIIIGVGLLGVVAAGVALWMAQRRWVLDPLAAIGQEVRQVADGDIGHQVQVAGPREIADLARDVEAMRMHLADALDAAVAAQRTLREQAEQLAEQADDLRRSNAELEQFAYVASHDLQEPLRKVASFCQLLERRYADQLDDRAKQYIAFAVDGAKRMQRLINDLLAFSRVGRTTSEFTEVDLNVALERALISLTAAREEGGAEVEADPLPTVLGNGSLLSQVFQNLIGNGIKFRGDDAPRVRITVQADGGEWLFACADNGIGIQPRYAERVFVIFQRLHGKEEYDGTGIGLALCRKIIEHHGGRMWLDTEAHAGTTMWWTIPMIGAERPPLGTAGRTELAATSSVAPAETAAGEAADPAAIAPDSAGATPAVDNGRRDVHPGGNIDLGDSVAPGTSPVTTSSAAALPASDDPVEAPRSRQRRSRWPEHRCPGGAASTARQPEACREERS